MLLSCVAKCNRVQVTGLRFPAFSAASGARRLLASASTTCSNLQFSGSITTAYDAATGTLSLTFPGAGSAAINLTQSVTCSIQGFTNPPAALPSAASAVQTFDAGGAGQGFQSSVSFPSVSCGYGTYQISSASVQCVPCAAGSFNAVPGSPACSRCPTGSYSTSVAASSAATCRLCPASTYGNASGASTAESCTACPAGTSSAVEGASACVSCAPGLYSTGQQAQCSSCPIGTFSPATGATTSLTCMPCAAGTFSKSLAAPAASSCAQCPPGHYSSEGSSECTPCPAGTFSTLGGVCSACPSITWSLVPGAITPDDCTGIQVDVGGPVVVQWIAISILATYVLCFLLVPSWNADVDVRKFKFRVVLSERRRSTMAVRRKSWVQTVVANFKSSEDDLTSSGQDKADGVHQDKKCFFELGDRIIDSLNRVVGVIESTSVAAGQDPVESPTFNAFVRILPEYIDFMEELGDAGSSTEVADKPLLRDVDNLQCRCRLMRAPDEFAHKRLCGRKIEFGRYATMKQINVVFQLFILSMFPAVDTISDLAFVLSTTFVNRLLFGLSLCFLTTQFWVFNWRLQQRRVFEVCCCNARSNSSCIRSTPPHPPPAGVPQAAHRLQVRATIFSRSVIL
jgi:hypothetical protein